MCGIVGMVNVEGVEEHLIRSLARLEYRGYDSAGICTTSNGNLWLKKCRGKVGDLAALLKGLPIASEGRRTGIGHTRWATHGKPSRQNAHPHTDCKGKLAVVHNGIIENYSELRAVLEARGCRFQSETDTEVIAHLVEQNLQGDMLATLAKALPMLKGSYALVILSSSDADALYFARSGSPLVAGVGDGCYFLASDVPALLPYTRKVVFLDDGDYGVVSAKGIRFFHLGKAQEQSKRVETVVWDAEQAAKGGYDHFMLKEIFEQPRAVADTLSGRIDEQGIVSLPEVRLSKRELLKIERIHFVACGTAYYAGLSGLYFFEERLPFFHDDTIASEFRYRDIPLSERDLLILISQSGETADTLAALRKAKQRGVRTLAICNVVGSTIAREADDVLFTRAGPEIGVASTKAYTSQIVAAYLVGMHFARQLGIAGDSETQAMTQTLKKLPELLTRVLEQSKKIAELAPRYAACQNFLFLGRHLFYPSAMEGALKLKEISYIHAEGYPAGEMKHGPIALIDKELPVVCIAPKGACYDKMVSNIQEVRAREGRVLAVVTETDEQVRAQSEEVLTIPDVPEWVAPILVAPHLQLIAYYLAKERGCEIDQPRNLAKSVTVE